MLLIFRSSVSLNILEVVTATPEVTLAVTPEVTLAVTPEVTLAVTQEVTMTSFQAISYMKLLNNTALVTTPGTSRKHFYLISRTSVSRTN
jgi:hypothetical protein